MYQSVEMPSGFLYLLSHVVVAVEVKHIGNQIEGILIVLNLGVEAGQVESVCEVFFVDLAKVLIASGRYELQKSVTIVLQGVPRQEMNKQNERGRKTSKIQAIWFESEESRRSRWSSSLMFQFSGPSRSVPGGLNAFLSKYIGSSDESVSSMLRCVCHMPEPSLVLRLL